MPVKKCTKRNKAGYKWGEEGKCYTYEEGNERSRKRARKMAIAQGRAIKANKGG